jgi:uncharacterized membrane protein
MELYYLFLHAWLGVTALFGLHPTEFVVRLPSTIFAASSTVALFLLGQRFLGLLPALAGAGLYLLNDLQLVYAQQARSFSLQLLLLCVAWYAFLASLTGEAHQKRWWLCFILATSLATYAHLFSLIILLAQLCTFGLLLILPGPWRAKAKRQMTSFLISLVVIATLIIPLLPASLQGPKTGWLPIPQLKDIPRLFLAISGNNKMYLLMLATCCLTALIVAVQSYLPADKLQFTSATKWKPGHTKLHSTNALEIDHTGSPAQKGHQLQNGGSSTRRSDLQQFLPIVLALLCWLVVPITVSYLISQGSVRLFSSRYLVTIVPPLLLLVGLGISSLRWQPLRIMLVLGIFTLALFAVPYYYRSAQVEDWNRASFWVEQHYQPGDGLVCYDNATQQGCQVSLEYYLHAYPGAAHFSADAPGAFSWASFGSADPDAAVNPTVLAVFATKHSHIFFIVGRLPNNMAALQARYAQSWLDKRYHFVAQIVTRTVDVRLYTTNKTTAMPSRN